MFYKVILILIALTTLASSATALAAVADIGAPVVQQFEAFNQTRQGFIGFLSWLFPVMLSVATIAAVVSLIIAGFQWMAGAISPPQIEAAQTRIWAAVSGLALALGSWLIVYTINPDLIKLRPPTSTFNLECPGNVCPSWQDILFGSKDNLVRQETEATFKKANESFERARQDPTCENRTASFEANTVGKLEIQLKNCNRVEGVQNSPICKQLPQVIKDTKKRVDDFKNSCQ